MTAGVVCLPLNAGHGTCDDLGGWLREPACENEGLGQRVQGWGGADSQPGAKERWWARATNSTGRVHGGPDLRAIWPTRSRRRADAQLIATCAVCRSLERRCGSFAESLRKPKKQVILKANGECPRVGRWPATLPSVTAPTSRWAGLRGAPSSSSKWTRARSAKTARSQSVPRSSAAGPRRPTEAGSTGKPREDATGAPSRAACGASLTSS